MNKLSSWNLLPIVVLTACVSSSNDTGHIAMDWEPLAALNDSLPPGVRVYSGENASVPLRAWYVAINEPDQSIRTRVVVSADPVDARETASDFAANLGACVVVNGGYFRMDLTPARHVGLLLSDLTLLEPATSAVTRDSLAYEIARGAIGFAADGRADITWATTRRDTVFTWSSPPRHRPGRPAAELDYSRASAWDVVDALAAGPVLVTDGQIQVTANEEVFFGTSIPRVHPRTAVGLTQGGSLIVMVVDGRQASSRGVSLEELAVLMRDVGAHEALNLDGGGSSTLVVNQLLVNRPVGSLMEREVMSALATFCE